MYRYIDCTHYFVYLQEIAEISPTADTFQPGEPRTSDLVVYKNLWINPIRGELIFTC